MKNLKKVMIVGDTHFPYSHKSAIEWVQWIAASEKPNAIVHIGDIYDFFWFSNFRKSLLNLTAEQEYEMGRYQLRNFWENLRKNCPQAKFYQLLGNHDDRPLKRIMEKIPALEHLQDIKQLFKVKGVTTILDSREELTLTINGDQVMFHHGHYSQLGKHMVYNQCKTVVGHTHRGGVVFQKYVNDIHWELNVGCLCDDKEGPLKYGAQSKTPFTLGLGIIDHLGPRFVPYLG